ncbi:MAG: radical SAM/SPASM domain-containing protein [Granulicella sp.]
MYTATCPLECRDCIVSASPRAQGKMTPETALECIKIIPKYSDTVCFTGGEPMLYYNEILPLVREANALGLMVTMVTGCGWVRLEKEHIARERIFALKEAGLTTLCVSWDVYHEEFAPKEYPLLIIKLCKEAGIPVVVRGVIGASGEISNIKETLIQIEVPYQRAQLMRLGSAETLPDDHFAFNPTMEKLGGACSVINTPVVEYNGRVYACCGPSRHSKSAESPLVLGDITKESLDSILYRSVRDPILEAINTIGPLGVFRLMNEDPAMKDLLPVRAFYTGFCELCLDMFDIPDLVAKIRERLSTADALRLLTAAKMFEQADLEMKKMTYMNNFV